MKCNHIRLVLVNFKQGKTVAVLTYPTTLWEYLTPTGPSICLWWPSCLCRLPESWDNTTERSDFNHWYLFYEAWILCQSAAYSCTCRYHDSVIKNDMQNIIIIEKKHLKSCCNSLTAKTILGHEVKVGVREAEWHSWTFTVLPVLPQVLKIQGK